MAVSITPQNITSLPAWQLEKAFASIPPEIKAKVFEKLNIKQLLLIVSKIQYAKKNDELEKITNQLKGYTEAIAIFNQESSVARKASTDDKPYTWPPEVAAMAAVMDKKLGRPKQTLQTKANNASEQLANYSKQMNEEAKRLSSEAGKMRQELSALQETFSSILDAVNKAVKKVTEKYGS